MQDGGLAVVEGQPLDPDLGFRVADLGRGRPSMAMLCGFWDRYEPRPPETESPAAPSAEQGEVPFGGAVRLSVNHQPGPLRIFALFSYSPISSARVEAAIKAMRPDAEVLPLEGDDVAQRSVRIEVAK